MKKIAFAQKAFIVHDNKLLLVRKSEDDPLHPGKWEVPGGRLEFGETLDDHIRREVMEEVGLEIEPLCPFAMWTWIMSRNDDEIQVIAVGRRCRAITTKCSEQNRVADDFLSEIKWIELDQIYKYELIPDLKPAMEEFVLSAFDSERHG